MTSTRQTYLGSSDSPAVLGVGFSGENQHSVWSRKVGLEEEREDSELLLCGRILQPAICELLRLKTNYDVRPHDESPFRHGDHQWLGATPDSFIHGDPRGLGIGELKNVGTYNASEWNGDEPPLRVAVQLNHQMLVCGATWGIVAGLIGGNRLIHFEVGLHSRLIDAMLPTLRKFWGYVESRTPPPIDGSEACSSAIKALYPKDSGAAIMLPPESSDWWDELSTLKAAEKFIGDRKTLIENNIKYAMGEAAIGNTPDGHQFSWKTQPRAGYTVEAGTTRPLKQVGSKSSGKSRLDWLEHLRGIAGPINESE